MPGCGHCRRNRSSPTRSGGPPLRDTAHPNAALLFGHTDSIHRSVDDRPSPQLPTDRMDIANVSALPCHSILSAA